MGFKEVMALRQEGRLKEALIQARDDYSKTQDQWSSSALFWVLKDIATQNIEEDNINSATPLIHEMEEIVGYMGATSNVAMDTLAELQKSVIPHFNELSELSREILKCKNRIKIKEIYTQVMGWLGNNNSLPNSVLHEDYAQVLLSYLHCYYQHIPFEEVNDILQLYLSLSNPRPSKIHSAYLKLALKVKHFYAHNMLFNKFVEAWGISSLSSYDWERGKGGTCSGGHSLAELVLFEMTTEAVTNGDTSLSEATLILMNEVSNHYPDDELLQLSRARAMVMSGEKEQAIENYESLLMDIEAPMAWAEYAYLVDNKEIQLGALCMALREENNDYLEYLSKARTELAKLLIERQWYSNALRELTFVSQICLEKSRPLPNGFDSLMEKIPAGTVIDRENKDFYYQNDRAALAHIYRSLPTTIMMVYDVMAMRLKDENNQVVPMLKLITPEGKTALVTPKEAGILPGDNRGLTYEVKIYERYRKHTKVVQLTHLENIDPYEVFPVKMGIINGYSEVMHAYHVMDNNSRHHYLPSDPNEFVQGEFIKFIYLIENQQRKNQPPTPPREYIYHVRRVDPEEAIMTFDTIKAVVEAVRNDSYLLRTEKGVPSTVNHSVSPVTLEVGDTIIVRGFQQRHKDRVTGQPTYSFVTLSIEPYFG